MAKNTKNEDRSPATPEESVLDTNQSEQSISDFAVNAYRITQLEARLEELKASSEKLSFSQIKQMFGWIGLPVVIATSVFGVSLWQTIQSETTSAAERRASETVDTLTSDIDSLQGRIQILQTRSQETFEELRELRGRAEESARSVQRQADNAEDRATEAAGALAQLRRTAASAQDIQQALGNVDDIAGRLAQNSDFRELVSQSTLASLSGVVVAFDESTGCPPGWRQFEAAAGRAIIGVGQGEIDQVGDQDIPLTDRRWREFGGRETHTLIEPEMPTHSHQFSGRTVPRGGWGGSIVNPVAGGGSQVATNGGYTPEGSVSLTGQGKPHNNMPPYVALYFCKKV